MKRFVFSLDPLLQKHRWESDVLCMEKTNATRAVEAVSNELKMIEKRISEYQDALIQATLEDTGINLGKRQVIGLYLQHQQVVALQTRKSLAQAQAVELQISEQLTKTLQQLKTLEKLKAHAKQKYQYQQLRTEQNEADDHWLARYNPT